MEGMLAALTFGMDVRDEAFKAALASDRAALQQTERQFQSSGAGMGAPVIPRVTVARARRQSMKSIWINSVGLLLATAPRADELPRLVKANPVVDGAIHPPAPRNSVRRTL